ncbi:eukaryotic translation initiation factor 4E-like [Argiope bruennichi]|uniref:eukaryotic translation initiation factor 4E-like n=1 Tax=Argiope bruennichi TaxID=94029 RepID=UPI00249419CB|nr:eukaryotic translation initiation factor 4E-like [Argiope bruennichi]
MSVGEPKSQENAVTTEVSPEMMMKHPLQHVWSLWFYKNDRTKTWEENLTEIASFDTVEDFWSLYNHIEIVSKLPPGCDYALFKHGIKPMWEDEKNKHGGRWLINLQKYQRNPDLNSCWLEVLLCMIGEAFDDYGEDVCGAVVQVRAKVDKLALWTADVENKEAIMRIGELLKDRLHIHPRNGMIVYEPHAK